MFDGFVLCSSELLAYFAASIWVSFLISQIPGPPVGQRVPTVSACFSNFLQSSCCWIFDGDGNNETVIFPSEKPVDVGEINHLQPFIVVLPMGFKHQQFLEQTISIMLQDHEKSTAVNTLALDPRIHWIDLTDQPGWWLTYPSEKSWSESQLGWWNSQLNGKS